MGEKRTGIASHPQDFIWMRTESGSEEVHYSICCEDIPDEYQQVALETLNETEENKKNGLKKLKAFMKKEDMTCPEEDLTLVLRNCKYDIRKSEKKLKRFLKLRQRILERLIEMEDSKADVILDHNILGALPYRDKHGRAILFTQPINLNFNLYSADDLITHSLAYLLWICSSPLTSITGIGYIGEAKTDDLHALYTGMTAYLSSIKYILEFPMRIAKADIVNENWVFRLFYNIMRPLLPEKIRKRLTLNGSGYENLKKSYHPNLLPKEFGGNLDPINNTYYKESFLEFYQKLKEESKNLKQTRICT